jgi:hypothetical protein
MRILTTGIPIQSGFRGSEFESDAEIGEIGSFRSGAIYELSSVLLIQVNPTQTKASHHQILRFPPYAAVIFWPLVGTACLSFSISYRFFIDFSFIQNSDRFGTYFAKYIDKNLEK